MQRAGGAYIEIRADSKKLPGDLNKAHSKVASTAKKMESSITKAFKRMAFVATAAFAVVAYKTISLVKETALLAARFETLEIVMKQVGKNAGYSAEQMDEFDKNLRATGISMIESRNSLARMAQAQLDLTQATKLGRIAQDAAVIGNINSSEAFQRMIYGIQSGQTEVLKTIGINVNFQNSYMAVAKATNRAVTSFSEAEKATIRLNTVVNYGPRIMGVYIAAMTTAGKKLTSFIRYVDDFKVKMGLAFGPATVMLVDAATKAMKEFQVEISKPEAQEALRMFASNLAKVAVELSKDLPSKISAITEKLDGIWKIISYDPAILEWGLIGLVLGGKKGALLMSSLAHMTTWADNLGKALGLVSAGILDISQVATANFKELQELIDRFDFPDPLKDLQLHAKELKEEIEHLEKVTIGRARFFKGDKEDLIRARIELTEIQSKIAKIKEETFIKGLITFKMPIPPKIPEETIIPKFADVTQEEYKIWKNRSDAYTEMLDGMRKKQLEYFDKSIELRKSFSGRDLEAIIAAEQEKFDIQIEFDDQYFEMGKTRFDLERAQLDRQVKIWEEAEISKDRISKLYADKSLKITQAETEQRLSFYQSMAGGIANVFTQIAQAGGKSSEKAFRLYQAFAITEAIIAANLAAAKVVGQLGIFGIPLSSMVWGMAMANVAMIAAAKPPSYETGIDYVPETGPAILHEGEQVIPKAKARKVEGSQKPTINIILNNPVFQDLETQRQVMAQIASVVAAQVAPGAVVENYNNDGPIRSIVRGGM